MSISEDEIKVLENYTKNGSTIEDNDLQNISGGVKLKSFVKGAALTLVSAAGIAGLVYTGGKFLKKKRPAKIIPTISEKPSEIPALEDSSKITTPPPVDHMGTPLGSSDLEKHVNALGTDDEWEQFNVAIRKALQ